MGHIPQRRMQRLESFPNEFDLRQYGIIVVVIKIVKFGVMIDLRSMIRIHLKFFKFES